VPASTRHTPFLDANARSAGTSAERGRVKFAYFVHDLLDPAVERRLRMLREGGAEVTLLGFARGSAPVRIPGASSVTCLGRTYNARMAQRCVAMLRAIFLLHKWRDRVADTDVFIGRQLETLVLASVARWCFARSAGMVFECLDIHRLMLAHGMAGRLLRAVERYLLRRCNLLVISSPAFLRAYFQLTHPSLPPVYLLENRVLASECGAPPIVPWSPGPPWRIGWFGVIRCRRSLKVLARLVRRYPGQVEVVIRGRPARDAIPEFDAIIDATPGLHFLGPYDRAKDLACIYADIHYAWAIDFYEADANSMWLLPNRLYEAGVHGVVPIVLQSVETGRWLQERHAGVRLAEPLDESLAAFVRDLDTEHHAVSRAAMQRIPLSAFVCDTAACRDLVHALAPSQPQYA
jgi:succinoglycan biosynthesis protein ExoL